MNKFKIGDIVECIEKPNSSYGITVGNKYIVQRVSNDETEVQIDCDKGFRWQTQWILASRFKK